MEDGSSEMCIRYIRKDCQHSIKMKRECSQCISAQHVSDLSMTERMCFVNFSYRDAVIGKESHLRQLFGAMAVMDDGL